MKQHVQASAQAERAQLSALLAQKCAEVDAHDETTRFLCHGLLLLRLWHLLSILTDAELQLPALA